MEEALDVSFDRLLMMMMMIAVNMVIVAGGKIKFSITTPVYRGQDRSDGKKRRKT